MQFSMFRWNTVAENTIYPTLFV